MANPYTEQLSTVRNFATAAGKGLGAANAVRPKEKRVDLSGMLGAVDTIRKNMPRDLPPQQSGPSNVSDMAKRLGTVTTKYGGGTRYEKSHKGIDIANEIGTPIPAFAGGKVVDVRTGLGQTPDTPSYGNYVIVEDRNGNKWRYSHLASSWVRVGDVVQPGQFIAPMGNTGSTYSTHGGSGSHLDLRIVDAYNNYINPAQFGIL